MCVGYRVDRHGGRLDVREEEEAEIKDDSVVCSGTREMNVLLTVTGWVGRTKLYQEETPEVLLVLPLEVPMRNRQWVMKPRAQRCHLLCTDRNTGSTQPV